MATFYDACMADTDEHSTPVLGAAQISSAYTTSTPNSMHEVTTRQARAFTPVDVSHAQRARRQLETDEGLIVARSEQKEGGGLHYNGLQFFFKGRRFACPELTRLLSGTLLTTLYQLHLLFNVERTRGQWRLLNTLHYQWKSH
jgi:hypothetical protein